MEIAALVLGIVGLVLSFFGSSGGISIVCSTLAIIFGAISMKKEGPNQSKAKTGLILGIVSLGIGIALSIVCVACTSAGLFGLAGLIEYS